MDNLLDDSSNLPPPSKRFLTDDKHASQRDSVGNQPASNAIDDDLTLRLRNMGSRIRKSVSQGYSFSSVGAPQVPPITKKLPFTKSASFRSDNDTMRDVFATADSQTSRHASLVDKRKHEDDEDDICLSEDDVDMSGKGDVSTRPMRPLKQVRGRGTATQSLPTFRLPTDAELSGEANILGSGTAMEEEDWSKENFA